MKPIRMNASSTSYTALDQPHVQTCTIPPSSDEHHAPTIFNYARVFSWSRAVDQIATAFEKAARHASHHISVTRQAEGWKLTKDGSIRDSNRRGNSAEVLAYISAPPCGRWAPGVWNRFILSVLSGLFVQWATTGSAIWMAYVTPTQGLG